MAKRNVVDFKIINLSEEKFQELKEAGQIDPNAIYVTPDVSLKTNQITNCITEIPQDIKLELNNGTLTLKAGSKVYVPNGVGVFDLITIQDDIATTVSYNGTCTLYYAPSANACSLFNSQADMSGTTDPTTTANFYNTEQNLIKRFNGSVLSYSGLSFPLCRCTTTTDGVSSIDVVFNGFGYIGSTVFALPGVKGLIPNGRNEDGSLKNIEFTNDKVLFGTGYGALGKYSFRVTPGGIGVRSAIISDTQPASTEHLVWYNPKDNFIYRNDGKDTAFYKEDAFMAGSVDCKADKSITSLQPKTAFHAVDYNDFETEISNAVHKTGDETISGTKTFTDYVKASAGVGVQIEGTTQSFNLRSSGATPEGCGLFLDNDTSKAAFNASSYRIQIGSDTILPHSVTPASTDNSTRIATTGFVKSVLAGNGNGFAAFSKATNGYYLFVNGLLIQWGTVSGTINSTTTVSMPTAFASATAYSIATTATSTTPTEQSQIVEKGSGSFKVTLANSVVYWIAIGYR